MMIGLVIGLVLGVVIGGVAIYAYQRQQTRELREDRHLLAARLRSLVALIDQGLLDVREPEVKQMLLDTRALLADGLPLVTPGDRVHPDRMEAVQTDRMEAVQTGGAKPVQSGRPEPLAEDDEEELPSLFHRESSKGSRQ